MNYFYRQRQAAKEKAKGADCEEDLEIIEIQHVSLSNTDVKLVWNNFNGIDAVIQVLMYSSVKMISCIVNYVVTVTVLILNI